MSMSSRNLNRYFKFSHSDVISSEYNLVLIGVRSRKQILKFEQNTFFDRVDFDIKNAFMYLYVNNLKYTYCVDYCFCIDELDMTEEKFVNEIFVFIERGHSIKHKNCTCECNLSSARYADYGLSNTRYVSKTPCILFNSISILNNSSIESEIGIYSMHSVIVSDRSILEIIQDCILFEISHHNTWILSDIAKISNKISLFNLIQKNVMGLSYLDKRIQYELMSIHISELIAENKIIFLLSENRIFPVLTQQQQCDHDIRDLWKKCKND